MNLLHHHSRWAGLLALPLTLATLILAPGSSAQNRTASTNAQRETLTAKVDKLFAPWDKPDSPGCSLGVIKDGRFIYRRGYGMANLDHSIPLSPTSVFYIASTSKQFAAASVALLARQGKISLDDDIRKYLPEMPRYQRPVTIRQLVHHTSGIRDYLTLMSLAGMRYEDIYSEEEMVALPARQKELNFTPGDEHLYSNSGYFLLSVIVKRASGKSLRQFADEQIFKPLGMSHTHFHDDRAMVVKNRVTSYFPQKEGGFGVHVNNNFDKVGDGGLLTTIEDLARWDRNFYDYRVGGKELVDQLLTPGELNNGEKLQYAFGLNVGPSGFEYQRAREFMTEEVKAAIDAAFEAGATKITVSDSHGNGQNLLIEKLPRNITLVRAFPRPLVMMQGIDETFDGVIFLGYHTSTTNPQGVRAHTMSSASLADVRLNGASMPEAGVNAAIACHFNVPVIMISGDDAIVKEATALLGDIEGAVVKWAYGFHSARTLMPEAALEP